MKSFFLIMTLPIFIFLQNALGEVTLPEGPGRDIVYKRCQTCHQLTRIEGKKYSAKEWEKVVGRMIQNGLKISQEEKIMVIDYLATHFGMSSSK